MVALKVEEQKAFTEGLFIGEIFDKFLVREAEIVTWNRFSIDGKIRQGYFSEEDQKGYRFCICENCFQELVIRFAIPVEMYEQTELI